MSRRSSVGFVLSPSRKHGGRLSVGGRRSIGGMGPLTVTPATSKSTSGAMETPSVYLGVPENNDEEELRQRQLSRLQQLQSSRQLGSPSAETPGGADRNKSETALEPRLTGQQLSMHYAKCIQLSAENKINIKNAFNLQLIDYMTEMLRAKNSKMNNFQVASCTLDASTKIYAYRVDCVHTDTIRMAGGLGRTHQDKPPGEGGEEVEEGEQAPGVKQKRRRTKKAATIESNPSNLTLSSLDLEFMVDPLFKKIASQFDEGRAGGGLFLNSLMLRDDSCQMLLDSEAVLDTGAVEEEQEQSSTTVTIPPLPDLNLKEICPSFSSFHFTSWKVGDEDSFCDSNEREDDDDHAFDVNAVPEPLVNDIYADDHADYAGGVEDMCGDNLDDTMAATLGTGGNNTCLTVGWEGQHANSTANSVVVQPVTMETIHLKDHLASMPLEYSYFDARVISAWAGPGHWKLKPAARDKTGGGSLATADGSKKRKKVDYELSYRLGSEEKAAIEQQFTVSRRLTKLSQNTIKLWSEDNTTLPVDLHLDPSDFSKLFGRCDVVVRRHKEEDDKDANNITIVVADEGFGDDSEQHQDRDDDDYADNAVGDVSGGGYDMTLFSQTMVPPTAELGADFFGDNLVAAPSRVAKLNIGYARTAKRMDMKKLKSAVWSMLTNISADKENNSNSANIEPVSNSTNAVEKPVMESGRQIQFSQIYRCLPKHVNARMAENLSLPLAFIALLHLCNERNLALTPTGNMEDFSITQD
uniref:Condensin complex subunit 2 n=2 Tax=Hirondellea gigas TaxID=1518452 RepID=A0A6A7FYS5_9CRUS